jgi:hypothetical protein
VPAIYGCRYGHDSLSMRVAIPISEHISVSRQHDESIFFGEPVAQRIEDARQVIGSL